MKRTRLKNIINTGFVCLTITATITFSGCADAATAQDTDETTTSLSEKARTAFIIENDLLGYGKNDRILEENSGVTYTSSDVNTENSTEDNDADEVELETPSDDVAVWDNPEIYYEYDGYYYEDDSYAYSEDYSENSGIYHAEYNELYNSDGPSHDMPGWHEGYLETYYNASGHYLSSTWTLDDEGFYHDENGRYVVGVDISHMNDMPYGTVVDTGKGEGVVYDYGSGAEVHDFATNWIG